MIVCTLRGFGVCCGGKRSGACTGFGLGAGTFEVVAAEEFGALVEELRCGRGAWCACGGTLAAVIEAVVNTVGVPLEEAADAECEDDFASTASSSSSNISSAVFCFFGADGLTGDSSAVGATLGGGANVIGGPRGDTSSFDAIFLSISSTNLSAASALHVFQSGGSIATHRVARNYDPRLCERQSR